MILGKKVQNKRADDQQLPAWSTGTVTKRVIRESSKVARKEDVLRSANATGVATKVMPTEMIAAAMVMPIEKATTAIVHFPLCDAAVRKWEGGEWELADAVLAECSETGEDGVRNGSYAQMKAMRDEIAKNCGVELSLERIRKLRKAASTFPPGRRRPAVALEGHLEAGTPEALDAFINNAPKGTALTRQLIRQLKHPDEKAEQDQQADERRHQSEDQRAALQKVCRQLDGKMSSFGSVIQKSAAAPAKSLNRLPRRCRRRTSPRSPSPKIWSKAFAPCWCPAVLIPTPKT